VLTRAVHPPARVRSRLDRTRRSGVLWALAKERRCRWGIYGSTEAAFYAQNDMNDPERADTHLLEATIESFAALREVLSDVQGACDALPQDEQQRYREAQQSVVRAKRSAETHEGLLQVC
jgi:hypothetical protein